MEAQNVEKPWVALVVDDEEEIRILLKEMLERLGYKVVTADNGKEGLEILRKGGINLVFTDIIMPVMPGDEMIAKMQSENIDVPTIIMTGGTLDRKIPSGHTIITKPFGLPEIIRITEEIKTS